jgi:hypothetical protein
MHRVNEAEAHLGPFFAVASAVPRSSLAVIGSEAGKVVMLVIQVGGHATRHRRVTHQIAADGSVVKILDRKRGAIQSSERRRGCRRSPAMP